MGRKRLDEDEKKVKVHIYIKKKLHDEMKEKEINISQFVEEEAKKFLKR